MVASLTPAQRLKKRDSNLSVVRSLQSQEPVAFSILRDLDLPGLAAHWTILHIRLPPAASLVDDDVDRFAAVGTTRCDRFRHGRDRTRFRAGRPAEPRHGLEIAFGGMVAAVAEPTFLSPATFNEKSSRNLRGKNDRSGRTSDPTAARLLPRASDPKQDRGNQPLIHTKGRKP